MANSKKEKSMRAGRTVHRQWKRQRMTDSNATPRLLYSRLPPAITSPPLLCRRRLGVYSRRRSREVAARLMMPALSPTFHAAERTSRWRVNRAPLTYRPPQCFSIVTHTHTRANRTRLPRLIRTNMSVYQPQRTHLRMTTPHPEGTTCARVDKKPQHINTHCIDRRGHRDDVRGDGVNLCAIISADLL